VCLACGAELGSGNPGLIEKVPKPVLLGGLVLLVLVVVGVVGAKIYASQRLSGLIAEGQDKISKGDVKGARVTFEEILKTHKDHPAALEGLVQVGSSEGKWTLVKQYAPPLIGKLPKGDKRARVRLDLARAQLESGDYQTAQRTARDAESDDPSLRGVDEVAGLALLGANEKIEAFTVLKKADSDGSRDARVGLGLAKLTEEKGDVHGARVWADKASAFATDANAWLECARLREKDGDRNGALGALKKACEADAKSSKARVELALTLLEMGSAAEAVKVAQEAKTLAPEDGAAARALGQALLETNDYAGAKAELERAERTAGEDPLPSLLLGRALIKLNDADAGVDKLEKALKKVEKDARAYLDAGRIVLNETPHVERAIAFLDKAVALEPRAPTPEEKRVFSEARVLLARALAKPEGGRAKAEKRIDTLLREAITDDPKRREAHLELGIHLQALDRNKESVEALEKGLELFPEDEELLFKAGVGGIKGKLFQKAVTHLTKLVSKNPNYPDAKNKLEAAKYGLQFEQ
jgi:tetratricopeptide (TPR) repeat protein